MEFYREFTKASSTYFGWGFTEYKGKIQLMEKLLNAQFDEQEVLVVPPGKQIVQSFDELIIRHE